MSKILFLITLLSVFPSSLFAFQKGMVLGLYSKNPSYSYKQDLKEIKGLGADHISLVVSWYQKDIKSTSIYPNYKPQGDFDTIPDQKIVEVIRQAHRLGLEVFLFPILRIEERKEKEWRGVLAPSNPLLWLENYRRFILHYAHLAATHDVKLFSVGSELCSMEKETKYWQTLIEEIRRFYKGKLIYSANWDHYRTIRFWDSLDYLGLNGYYEIAPNTKPNLKELTQKWWGIENELSNWQERRRKKIIFTEIGYPSIDGGCQKPWDYTRDTPIDLEEQALCYEAFFISWNRSQNLEGIYFWNWYGQGGPNDRTYTPRGKPAEKVLSKWWKQSLPKLSQKN